MEKRIGKVCPRCGSTELKAWTELDVEAKDMLARLGLTEKDDAELKKHRFCNRCWYKSRADQEIA